tara:strand:- start:9109 stop:9753 length:645 start_codon:yes stop_codon:yes gene_type:complete
MQADVERILGNLHILGALSHNDKLMTNDDAFDIYIPTTIRGLMRMWYGERRGQNVTRIRSTVRGAIEFSQRTLTDLRAYNTQSTMEDVDVNTLRRETMELQFRRMIDGLRRAREGLSNLIQTYRDDAALSSQIRLINEEIADFLSVMNRHAPSIPSSASSPCESPRSSPVATSMRHGQCSLLSRVPHLPPSVLGVASNDEDRTVMPLTHPPADL